jgi:RHS repeat-associated protein
MRQTATRLIPRPTKFDYDALGRRTKRWLPEAVNDLPVEETSYAIVAGHLEKTVKHFNGRRARYIYNALDQLISKGEVIDGVYTAKATFAYFANGLRSSMFDEDNNETPYTYDPLGRLITKGAITYNYDPRGNLTKISHNSSDFEYRYDVLNRLAEVIEDGFGAIDHTTRYTYDEVGNLQSVSYQNGATSTYAYNNRNRLTGLVVKKGSADRASFNYNPADVPLPVTGHRMGVDELIHVTPTLIDRKIRYAYDFRHRLERERFGVPSGSPFIAYDYDKVGNRESREVALNPAVPVLPNGLQTYSYDANDRLEPATNFDANGNTEDSTMPGAEPGTTWTVLDSYDFENRLELRTISNPALEPGQQTVRTIELFYDGDGHRVKKVVTEYSGGQPSQTTTTRYIVDDRNPTGYAQVLQEKIDINGASPISTRAYAYGLDLISYVDQVAVESTFPRFYYGYDGHGSVRFLTNPEGAITDTYTYDAFGILIAETHAGAPTPNNHGYAGEYWDRDLGLSYNRARYLSLNTGRFWTMDTFEGFPDEPLSLHKYLYAHSDPVNGMDPSGHMTLLEVKIVAAEIFVVATATLYRAAPALHRASVLLFEASTGNTVFVGGAGAGVALRQGTKLGGVGWSTWQFIGNLLKGSSKKVGTKKELSKVLEGSQWQANHLNQAKAFEAGIPYDEGVSVAMEFGTKDKGGMHWKFHDVLEQFWRTCRASGRKTVTNAEYDQVMRRALTEAGFPPEEVNALAKLAEESRLAFKYHDGVGGLQPVVPNPIPGM